MEPISVPIDRIIKYEEEKLAKEKPCTLEWLDKIIERMNKHFDEREGKKND